MTKSTKERMDQANEDIIASFQEERTAWGKGQYICLTVVCSIVGIFVGAIWQFYYCGVCA